MTRNATAPVVVVVMFLAGSLIIVMVPVAPSDGADGLFEDIDFGRLSIGGRAMYFNPLKGDESWSGGAQIRLYPWKMFAIEGSVDYRANDFGATRVHTYPVQVSGLLYLLPGKRLSPFILGGGGWYYTTVKGPGDFSDTENRFGLHAGGGLQFWFHEHFSIDSTYRYVWLENLASKDQNIIDKKFQDMGHMITIGLNFHF